MNKLRLSGQRISLGREKKINFGLLLLCLVFLVIGFLYLDSDLTGYAVFQTANSSDFNAGSYNLTFFNVTGFVQLNTTQGYYKGNYTSEIIDGGNPQSWNNISWCEGSSCLNLYGEELPANQKGLRTSSSTDRRINMTGNVLYFRFNNQSEFGETDGRNVTNAIYDFSGSHNNGSLGNNTANTDPTLNVTDCVFGNCYTFDAVNDHIRQDRNLTINNNTFSVSVWFKTTKDCQDSPGMMIIDGMTGRLESGFYISCVDSYGVQARVCDNDAGGGTCSTSSPASPKPLYNGFWHNIAFTRTDGPDSIHKRFLLYIDGILSENLSALHSGLPYDLGKPTIMIGDQVVAKMLFNGSIDEIAVWNRTLAATEIIAIYESGVNNLSLQVRSCNDSGCSGETFVGPDNTANTYFTNSSFVQLNETITPNNTYFQYKLLFESNLTKNTSIRSTPELWNVTLATESGPNNSPVINSNITSPTTPAVTSSVQLIANVSDEDGTPGDIRSVNFTLKAPNGTKVIDHVNGTLQGGTNADNWSSTTYTIDAAGTWTWTVNASDNDDNTDNDIGTFVITDSTNPSITSLSRRPETITTATSVTLNATITDNIAIGTVIISEDSSGSWRNYTITNPVSNVYSFILHSANLSQSQTVQYYWYTNDTSGNTVNTTISLFIVQSTSSQDTPSGTSTTTSPTTEKQTQTDTPISTVTETTTQTTPEQQPTTPQVELSAVGIQANEFPPEITNTIGHAVNHLITNIKDEPTLIQQVKNGVQLKQSEAKLGIGINSIIKSVENLKLDLGIKTEGNIQQPAQFQFEENYFETITRNLEIGTGQLKDNIRLLLNTRITKAQLQVKEVVTYAVLPSLIIVLLFVSICYGIYRLTSIEYKFLNVVQMYNLLIKMNRIEEAKILLLDIGEFNYRLSLKNNYPNLINEIKMKYPNIDETIKEAVIQKLNDGAEKFQDQIRNYMIKK